MILTLTEAGVEFVIVGNVSAVLQGSPIITQDLDLCYRRTDANLTRLAAALRSLKPRLRHRTSPTFLTSDHSGWGQTLPWRSRMSHWTSSLRCPQSADSTR